MKNTLNITGRTCASCANAVERTVRKMEGVQSASVNLASEKLFVEFDESITGLDQIKAAVEKIGYQAEQESDDRIREILLPISGMTCASCANAVQRSIGEVEGVREVNVNFATEKAKIIYDSSRTRISEIKNAVTKAGYQALDIKTQDQIDQDALRKEKQIRTLWTKFIISVFLPFPYYTLLWAPWQGFLCPKWFLRM